MSSRIKPIIATALLVLAAVVVTGCAHGEVDNVSDRPWNDTVGWQGGLPSGINQGR